MQYALYIQGDEKTDRIFSRLARDHRRRIPFKQANGVFTDQIGHNGFSLEEMDPDTLEFLTDTKQTVIFYPIVNGMVDTRSRYGLKRAK